MRQVIFGMVVALLPVIGNTATMDKRAQDFVAANLLAIYYHEFGHALIDIMKLPIFGQEEDAADVLSAIMINHIFDEDVAQAIALATARGFLGAKSIRDASRSNVAYWDVHGPDLQRYYTFACLIFGANPDARLRLADDLELPQSRRRTCPSEFEQASGAWGPVIEKLERAGAGGTIRFLADHRVGTYGKFTAQVVSREVIAMNRDLSLPKRLLVRVEPCNTINAFYDPKRREIIMCTEFAKYLAGMMPDN